MDNLLCINKQLQTCIRGLYKLIQKFLPQKYRQSIVKHITIFIGSVVCINHVHYSLEWFQIKVHDSHFTSRGGLMQSALKTVPV